MRLYCNPITGGTKAYRSSQSSAMALDSQRAMRILSNPRSDDGSPDEYIGSNDSFNLVDVKIAMDPEAQDPRRKVRAKDTKGLADLIASQGKSNTNLD